jgi:hypothetical protein
LTEDKVTVLLNGFDPESHYPIEGIKKDIDVLFIGNMLANIIYGIVDPQIREGYMNESNNR